MRVFFSLMIALIVASCDRRQIPDPEIPDTKTEVSSEAAFVPTETIVKSGKRIALTFDDIPRPDSFYMTGKDRSDKFIDQLAKANVKTTFFINTEPLAENTDDRLERYIAAGHSVANHSHSHPHLSEIGAKAYIKDIDEAATVLRNYENNRPWFRYPFLDEGKDEKQRDAVRKSLTERGLLNAYITVDHSDWYINTMFNNALDKSYEVSMPALKNLYVELGVAAAEFYHDLALKTYDRPVAQVFLLHENDVGALYLGDLIKALRKKDWEIITPEEAFADPIAMDAPETMELSQGRVGAQAIAQGIDPQSVYFPPRQPDYINQKFIDYEVLTQEQVESLTQ